MNLSYYSYNQSFTHSVLFYFEDEDTIPSFLKQFNLFQGKEKTEYCLVEEGKLKIFIGLGKKEQKKENHLAFNYLKAGILAAQSIKKIKGLTDIAIRTEPLEDDVVFFLMEGFFLEMLYENPYKKQEKSDIQNIFLEEKRKTLLEKAKTIADYRNMVRQLVDMPPNLLNTQEYVSIIQEKAKNHNLSYTVWDYEKLKEEKMSGLLAVGGASFYPPYLVRIDYIPNNFSKKIALAGKGIVFDSGGLCLKSPEGQAGMKSDMAGSATSLALVLAAQKLNLPIAISAYLPIAENSVSGKSYRVGDILTYRNGKTVEINNTDAEGRLILADALCLIAEQKYDMILDIATLTGACMVALGTDIYGVFSNHLDWAEKFEQFVNQKTSDSCWVLPLYLKYKEHLKSSIADFKNTGKKWGGAISAALFLSEFVPTNVLWAHLDIAGPSFDEGLGLYEGMATGVPLESVLLYLEDLTKQ